MNEVAQKQQDFVRRLVAAQHALRGYVMLHVDDPAEAEDILQEVSVVLWKKLDEYRPERPFLPWAVGIARYQILHSRRRTVRRRVVFDSDLAERIVSQYQALEPGLDRRAGALGACLKQLGDPARQVLDLRYGSGLSTKQIAEQLRKTSAAVDVMLFRIRVALADCVRRAVGESDAELGGSPE